MEESTSTELSSSLPEISEKSEDTPRGIETPFRVSQKVMWTLATTPLVLAPAADLSAYGLRPGDTSVIEETAEQPAFVYDFLPQRDFEEQGAEESEADITNQWRHELLARQYVAGQLSKEEQARLSIVTEKIRHLIPRVTAEDFEALEQILENTERRREANKDRLRRLGIG